MDPKSTCKTRAEFITDVLTLPHDCVEALIKQYDIPNTPRYPSSFLSTLSGNTLTTALRIIAVSFYATSGKEIPREHQLRYVLASLNNDSALLAGTGSGKTLAVALLVHMSGPNRVVVTMSPLKRLQITQVEDFDMKYAIPTMSVNADTPRNAEYWTENVFDSNKNALGRFRHFLVTTEQLFKMKEGYYSRFGFFLRNPKFRRHIARFCIDEAHFIYFARIPRYKLPAFRPAWGQLNEIKILFPKLPFHVLTATSPPHVLAVIERAVLKADYRTVRFSSNRPNTIYATHCVHDSLDFLPNYDCFLSSPFDLNQKRVLLFFDKTPLLRSVRRHLMDQLPDGLPVPKRDIVQYYDSTMSPEFLEKAHSDFTRPDGSCRVLCSTAAESTGVDFPDADVVGNMGTPGSGSESLQRGGRAIRRDGKIGLYLMYYEHWVLEIDLAEFTTSPSANLLDVDRPRTDLVATSNKKERVPYSMVRLLQRQEPECIRAFYRDYLDDKCPTALDYIGPHCCDRHQDGFVLKDWLPSKMYRPPSSSATVNGSKRKGAPRNTYRNIDQRDPLAMQLWQWRKRAHAEDPLHRPTYYILSEPQLKTLSWALSEQVSSPRHITDLLMETDDWASSWAQSVYEVIKKFEEEVGQSEQAEPVKKRQKRS